MNQNLQELGVSTTETAYRPPVQRDILLLESMYPNAMLMESTHHCRFVGNIDYITHNLEKTDFFSVFIKYIVIMNCSATVPVDIVGVWTVAARRDQEPALHLVLHPKTATEQVREMDSCLSSASQKMNVRNFFAQWQKVVLVQFDLKLKIPFRFKGYFSHLDFLNHIKYLHMQMTPFCSFVVQQTKISIAFYIYIVCGSLWHIVLLYFLLNS